MLPAKFMIKFRPLTVNLHFRLQSVETEHYGGKVKNFSSLNFKIFFQ